MTLPMDPQPVIEALRQMKEDHFNAVKMHKEWERRGSDKWGLGAAVEISVLIRRLDELERRARQQPNNGGCTSQLDSEADRKSVTSQRCRDTGGQPFESAPATLRLNRIANRIFDIADDMIEGRPIMSTLQCLDAIQQKHQEVRMELAEVRDLLVQLRKMMD